MDLEANGKQINIPLLDQLRGDGVSTGQLTGREEQLDNYGMPMWADWGRHGVLFNKANKKEAAINIREYGTPALTSWTKRWRRDDMVDALLSNSDRGDPHELPCRSGQPGERHPLGGGDACPAQQLVFGECRSRPVRRQGRERGGGQCRRLARQYRHDERQDVGGHRAFPEAHRGADHQHRQLAGDPPLYDRGWRRPGMVCVLHGHARLPRSLGRSRDGERQSRRPPARERSAEDEPDLHRLASAEGRHHLPRIPEIDTRYVVGTTSTSSIASPTGPLAGAGNSAVDVSPVFLCGQSALAYVVGQLPQAKRRDETDYQFLDGIGIEMQYGVGKIAKDKTGNAGAVGTLKDWGMVTGFVASVPDA